MGPSHESTRPVSTDTARQVLSKKVAVTTAVLFVAAVYLNNTTFLADPIGSAPTLVAHRGLGQDFSREDLTGETCTAARMIPSGHGFLENTIPSMQAAFDYGADFVEFDVHRTKNDRFAVFHDWTLGCRTNGVGVTRTYPLDSLQRLDVGFGYTGDGGQTFPFRGRGVGMMPSLEEVLRAFPHRGLIIDIKSQDASEGILLAERLSELRPEQRKRLMVYGGGRPVSEVKDRLPEIQTMWQSRLRNCLIRYAAVGWSGYVPADCRHGMIMIPANYAPWLWGWPNRFLRRMASVDSRVFLIGNYSGEGFSQGFDDPALLDELPRDYAGGIWTDRIDIMGRASPKAASD